MIPLEQVRIRKPCSADWDGMEAEALLVRKGEHACVRRPPHRPR